MISLSLENGAFFVSSNKEVKNCKPIKSKGTQGLESIFATNGHLTLFVSELDIDKLYLLLIIQYHLIIFLQQGWTSCI